MKNAHERFGFAEFEKRLKDTTTRIRLTADSYIGESADKNGTSHGHLLSVFGSDVEVAALWAAVLGEERLLVSGPGPDALPCHVWRASELYTRDLDPPRATPPDSPSGRSLGAVSWRRRSGPDHCQRRTRPR